MVFIHGQGTDALGRFGLSSPPIEVIKVETMPHQASFHP
jgi:hypothetical protein